MSDATKSNLLLAVMICWYVLLIIGSAFLLLMGLAFGSEVHRGNGIPGAELLMIYGPLLVSIALLIATIFVWTRNKRNVAIVIWVGSMLVVLIGFVWLSGAVV